MNFSLTPSLEQFIRDRANSGDYNNASEVVREAIRLLKRTEEERRLRSTDRIMKILGGQEPYLRERGVLGLLLFGSVLRDEAGPDSDVDVIIEIDPKSGFDLIDLVGIKDRLSETLGRNADVLTRNGIDAKIKNQVLSEAERVF